MIRKIKVDKKPIYVIADLHGFFNLLKVEIEINDLLKNCVIICAGDIGVGFDKEDVYLQKFEELNKIMENNNVDCFMIRGNHDDPSYFKGSIFLSKIKLIKDYTIISNGEHNILCVGGAISIDRKYRKKMYEDKISYLSKLFPNKSVDELKNNNPKYYWEDESPFLDYDMLQEFNSNNIKISYVVTHTSPSFAFKKDKDGIKRWIECDEKLDLDTSYERSVMDGIYNTLIENKNNLICWVYGHFHEHYEETINNTKFIALKNFDSISDIFRLA